jgi:hypothetical protein
MVSKLAVNARFPAASFGLPITMMRLTEVLETWGTAQFVERLKRELEQMDGSQLPLQQGLSAGSYVYDSPRSAMIISVTDAQRSIRVRAGIFYSGVLAGCSCADDPTPVEAQPEYCEVLLEIDKATADTTVSLVTE